MLLTGAGLYALVIAWAAGQAVSATICTVRIRARFPWVRAWSGRPGWRSLGRYLGPSGWASIVQFAHVLLSTTDLIVLGALLGLPAVVVYSCTVKLVAVLNNYPYQLVTSALPAVAELRAGGDRDRLLRACQALGIGVMGLSGALAVFLVALTPAFVPWWVGADQYGGPTLTLLAVLAMVVRHFIFAFAQMVFALGYDRRLAWALVGDGVVTVSAMVAWTVRARRPGRSARVVDRRARGQWADHGADAVRRNRGDAVGAGPVARPVGGAVRRRARARCGHLVLPPRHRPGDRARGSGGGDDRLRRRCPPAAHPRAARRLLVTNGCERAAAAPHAAGLSIDRQHVSRHGL